MAVNYNSPYFVDDENKVVGPEVFITPEMADAGWKGGKTVKLTNSNAKKFIAPIKRIHQRLSYPQITPRTKDPKTGKEIDEPDYATTHNWDAEKKKWVPKETKELKKTHNWDAKRKKWVPKETIYGPQEPDYGYDIEAEKASRAERGLPERISIRKQPLPAWTDPTYTGPAVAPDLRFPIERKPKPVTPLTGRRRALHRQRYGKELSGRLSEGLNTGKFDTVNEEDEARRKKLALTDDQSTLFLKKELARTIEDNIAADKDYYKKADNLDELENIFAVGEQIDPWSGNMTQANIERFINKIETRKPSKQEIYAQGKARLARQHASRFGPAPWDK